MPYKNIEAARANQRLRTRRYEAKNPEKKRKWAATAQRNYRAKNLDRARAMTHANVAVCYAVKNGSLIRPDICSQCGNRGRIEAHHHRGYAPEHRLDVVWLCHLCHRAITYKTVS